MANIPVLGLPLLDADSDALLSDNPKTFVAYEGVKPSPATKQKIRSHAMRFHRLKSRRNLELYGPEIRFGPIRIPTSNGSQLIARECPENIHKENATAMRPSRERGMLPIPCQSQPDPLSTINHQFLQHSQLLSAFLAMYWPASKGRIQEHTDDWIAYLPFIDMSNPLLRTCTEAMCLVKLGVRYNSNECLKQYRSKYGLALPMLANNLRNQTIRHDYLLVAMAMLLICELFDPAIYGKDHIGWMRHAYGAIQFAKNKGAEAWTTPLGRKVCIFLRHFAFCTALCERRASEFSSPSWVRVMSDLEAPSAFTDLYDTIQPLPQILEEIDRIQYDVSEQTALLGKLYDVFHKLEIWYTNWRDDLDRNHLTSLDQNVELVKKFQDQYGLPFNNFVITFPSIFDCSTHLMYWLVKIILVSNILNILPRTLLEELVSTRHFAQEIDSLTKLENAGLSSAMSFCQAMPYALEIHSVSLARHISLAMPLVETLFLRLHCQSEAAWCHSFSQVTYRSWEKQAAYDNGLANEPGWTIESSEQGTNTAFDKWWLRVLFLKH